MFSSAEPARTFAHHERHPSDNLLPSWSAPSRHTVEPPRPLEPRPQHQLQPSFSDAPGQRRPDAFRNPPSAQSEYRPPQAQSLPRLHDILTSTQAPSPPSYSGNGWTTAGPPSNQPAHESYYSHTNGYHPPIAQPPHAQEPLQTYHPQPGRRIELPVLETSPVTRHDSHTLPAYSGYPDGPSQYVDVRRDRPREHSAGSYHINGAPSPYTPAGTDEGMYRSPAATLERPPSNAFTPAGPESSKKYLGVRDIPGEGAYHFYEGGFRIPTHVDGETVNPAWGLTKANKPRKRLAMACLDCREKKIKCEPGPASCLQCEKAKRVCRKAPAQQSQSEPNTTPVWQNGAGSPVSRHGPSDLSPPRNFEPESDSANKRRQTEDMSPNAMPSKKYRSASPVAAMNGGTRLHTDHPAHQVSPTMPRSPGKVLSWEEDPYAVEPEMTMHLLELYFAHVNNATYCLFPRHHFMRWLTNYAQKCQNERLVLYSMLAIGSVFADDRYSGFGKHCANIATEAIQVTLGRFNMPMIQTRLLLGLYHFAKGNNGLSWDYIGSGINAASYLRYHTEPGCVEDHGAPDRARNEFGFSTGQLTECRRRTMWSAFLMDRYCGANHSVLDPRDIFIRLPCTDETYERGAVSNAPFYNNGVIDPVKTTLTAASAISPMAWLILVAAIWGDVLNFVHRTVHRSANAYQEQYEKFYDETGRTLENWSSNLPEHLVFNQSNMERSITEGYVGPFVSMHVLFHLSWLKMSRFARHEYIPRSITRNVRATNRHAHELLQVMSVLNIANRSLAEKNGHLGIFSLTTPFAGYAILSAIDVVGAGGLDSNLKTTLDLISCGLESLRELGRYWNSARDQDKACEKRYYQIHNVLKHPFTARSGCWLGREWGVHSSLEREFQLEDDCIYGVSDRDYFDALKDDINNNNNNNNNNNSNNTTTTTNNTANGRAPSGSLRGV